MNFWEDAVKGSGALHAGLKRRLQDECAIALGQHTASIFWDLERFYDSIDWIRAIEWALDLGFPPPRPPRRALPARCAEGRSCGQDLRGPLLP